MDYILIWTKIALKVDQHLWFFGSQIWVHCSSLLGLLSGNFLMATAGCDANLGMSLNWMWCMVKSQPCFQVDTDCWIRSMVVSNANFRSFSERLSNHRFLDWKRPQKRDTKTKRPLITIVSMDQHILWKLNYHSMESGLQTWRSCDRKWDTNPLTAFGVNAFEW